MLACWISASRAFRESLNETFAIKLQFSSNETKRNETEESKSIKARRERKKKQRKTKFDAFPYSKLEKIFHPNSMIRDEREEGYFSIFVIWIGYFGKFEYGDKPQLRFSKQLYRKKTRKWVWRLTVLPFVRLMLEKEIQKSFGY